MIKKFFFQNFKCFENVQINVESFTLLIGANASGKTNIIEGIYILSEMAKGQELDDIFRTSDGILRGTPDSLLMEDKEFFRIGCLLWNDKLGDCKYYITASFREQSFEIKDEIQYNENRDGVGESDIRQFVNDTLKKIYIISPKPDLMRGYSKKNDYILRPKCENVGAVLYHIYHQYEENILSLMRSLPENEIKEISFLEGSVNDVAFFVHEKFGADGLQHRFHSSVLSDGTLRCIALITAVFSVPEDSMVIVEEPDTGIHFSRILTLVTKLISVAEGRKVDIFATTHNTKLLNGLSKNQLVGVTVLYRGLTDGYGYADNILDIDEIPMLLTKGKVGDIFGDGILSEYLRNKGLE